MLASANWRLGRGELELEARFRDGCLHGLATIHHRGNTLVGRSVTYR